MSVVVAYAESRESEVALEQGLREAALRDVPLHVLAMSPDAEVAARSRLEIDGGGLASWRLHTSPHQPHQSHAVLDLAAQVDAQLVVVGVRRRSPVGKLLLGSLAQEVVLSATAPVLVVKPS